MFSTNMYQVAISRPGTALGTGDTAMKKTNKKGLLYEPGITMEGGEQ